jgi:hypothetical protein
MNNQDDISAATTKEKFDLGIGMLKGYYDGLETRVERTTVLLVGVVGWLITSQTARDSIAKSWVLFWSAVFGITVFSIYSSANISHFLRRFSEIQASVEDLNYADPKYFTRYRMPKKLYGIPIRYIYLMPLLGIYALILLLLFGIRFNLLRA